MVSTLRAMTRDEDAPTEPAIAAIAWPPRDQSTVLRLRLTARLEWGMSDNLVLELLRAIRGDIGVLGTDIRDMKDRLTLVEMGLAGVRRGIAGVFEQMAGSSLRADTLEDRVQRIERRLELIDQAP
jgi:hypothetical protein